MAASAKTLILDKSNRSEEWTVVLPRNGRHKRNISRIKTSKQQLEAQPWTPTDLDIDPGRVLKLMQKMQTNIKKLENSPFCQNFLAQIQTPEISDSFFKVLGSKPNMQMVIYGIGSIESYESPRLQLSLAILMKRKFSWIGNVDVFDPVISATETSVLEALGCSVLSVNEQGRRQALRPTLFFMPHCEAELYDNLLQANWRVDLLNHMVLFGNSFERYDEHISIFKDSIIVDLTSHIVAIKRFTKEFAIDTISDDYFRAFNVSSWHFFSLDPEVELKPIKL